MTTDTLRRLCGCALAASAIYLAAVPVPGHAQAAFPVESSSDIAIPADPPADRLSEIVVTIQKRQTILQTLSSTSRTFGFEANVKF